MSGRRIAAGKIFENWTRENAPLKIFFRRIAKMPVENACNLLFSMFLCPIKGLDKAGTSWDKKGVGAALNI